MRHVPSSSLESLRVLGAGASGEVVAVREQATGRVFARKRLTGGGGPRELALLARLRHPNLVALEGAGDDADGRYLLVELAGGGTLSEALARDPSRAASLLADALRALAFLHARGFVHGDVKPDNLLVADDGLLKVSDLGLARAAGAAEEGGTLAYMAPERLSGASSSPSSDLYALGVSFSVALGAPLPTEPRRVQANLLRWLTDAPVAAQLAPVLRPLLAADPKQRPSARAAARLLAQTMGDAALGHESPASARAWLRPSVLLGRDADVETLAAALERPGLVVLRAAHGAGGTRVLEELALRLDGRFAAGRDLLTIEAQTSVLCIDDADEADESLQAALALVQRAALEGEGTSRVVALVRPGGALSARLEREHPLIVDLPPLPADAIRDLVDAAFPDRGDSLPFANALHALSGGSPSRALAVLGALTMRGAVRPGALVDDDVPGPEVLDAFESAPFADALAASISEALPARSSERILASLAAVARRPHPLAIVRAAFELLSDAPSTFDRAVDELCNRGFARTGAAFALEGAHVRDALRVVLSAAELRRAHEALADALEAHRGDGTDALLRDGDRQHHLLASGDPASDAAGVARSLFERSLVREAESLLAAMDAVEPLTASERLLRARCLGQLGAFSEAVAEARRAARDGARGAPLLVAEILVRQGDYVTAVADLETARATRGHDAELDAHLARALALSGRHDPALVICTDALAHRPPAPWDVDLSISGALATFYKGDVDAARARYETARELARASHDLAREATAVNGLGLTAQRRGAFDEARTFYAAALELAEKAGDRARVGTSHLNLGTVLQELGRSRDAARAYRRSASVARLLGERVQSARARSNLANLLLYVGRLDEARTAAIESVDLSSAAGAGVVRAYGVLLIGEAALVAADVAEARARLNAASEAFSSLGSTSEAIEAEILLARLDGDLEAARAAASKARARELDRHEAQALLLVAQLAAHETRARYADALAAAHRALGLALPAKRPDLLWRIEAVLSRASLGDAAAQSYWADRALARIDEASAAVDEEDRTTFLDRPDRAVLRNELKAMTRSRGLPSRAADSRLTRLLAINRRLGAERNVKALLASIVDQAIELCGAERGFVLLVPENDGGELDVMVARNIDGESLAKGQLKVSHSIAERVMREGEPELTFDAQEDERYQKQLSVAALKLRSVLCVPLKFQGKVLGALYIDNRFRARAFAEDDLDVLENFADQASIALAQVRALEDASAARAQAEKARAEIEQLNKQLENRVESQEIEIDRARREAAETRALVARSSRFTELVGTSLAMARLTRQLERVAPTDLPVLVTGESGTGKELVARALFAHGPRKDKAFVGVNCGAFNEGVLESELFGHVRGAFTGADRDRDGLFSVAHGGTLFLDEVGEMSPTMQVKLLRALQEGEIRKVGGKDSIKVDVRIVAATNRDLSKMMKEGTFREDLFYRLNVVALQVPPLRERIEDLPALCAKLVADVPRKDSKSWRVSAEALAVLRRYPWPGNVRELRATLHNAALFAETDLLTPADFSNKPELFDESALPREQAGGVVAGRPIEDLELEAIRRTLELTKGNKSETARLLGIDRKTLYNKLNRMRARLDS